MLVLCTVMLTTVITSIDATIANVALPHMQGSLSATQDQISWVLTSYIVATAIFIPPTAFLAARLGRQYLMGCFVGGFLIASMLCGAATSLPEMVAFRFLQGAFGAGMMPLGQAIVVEHFPPEKRGQILAVWGVGAMFGPIIGPSLGGYLTEYMNWRWVFYVNVPICLLALAGVWRFIPNTGVARGERFDFFGFGLLSVAIGALQLLLDRGASVNWFESTEILIEATLAGLCFYLFVVHIFTARNPFIEPRLFTDRNLVAGLIIIAVASVALMGQMALLPSFLQQLMHIPADTTGLLMIPRGIASMAAMLLTARLLGRAGVDPRWIMVTGLLVLGLSLYDMSRISLYVDNAAVIRLGLTQGFGMSLLSGPMAALVFSTLADELYVEGAAMYNLMRSVGGSIGISMLFSNVAERTQVAHARLAENITAFEGAAPLPLAWQWNTTAGAMTLDGEIIRQAASVAYLHAFLVMALLVLATIPLCFLFRPSRAVRTDSLAGSAAEH
jgi:DHA2 family multidrug resistance protein